VNEKVLQNYNSVISCFAFHEFDELIIKSDPRSLSFIH